MLISLLLIMCRYHIFIDKIKLFISKLSFYSVSINILKSKIKEIIVVIYTMKNLIISIIFAFFVVA